MSNVCRTSHLALVGMPVTVIYEESSSFRQAQSASTASSSSSSNFSMMTSVAVEQLSIRELMHNDPVTGAVTDSVQLVKFNRRARGATKTDFYFVYKDLLPNASAANDNEIDKSNIEIRINPCVIDFDPGFVDRTYVLFNFYEFDPDCLVTEAIAGASSPMELTINVKCPDLLLQFRVPKADMRKPKDIPKFVTAFWSRRTHPELYELQIQDADLKVVIQGPEKTEPVKVRLSSRDVDVRFRETEESETLTLIQVRTGPDSPVAAYVYVTVCLDEENKLQGKYSSKTSKLSKKQQMGAAEGESYASGSFFVSESGSVTSGQRGASASASSNLFLQQLKYIREALSHGRDNHNILVDLRFDEVAVFLPSKHIYEVIYNRLGNDMLLWLPEIFRVKEHLFDCPLPDPLRDPNTGFSDCFSGVRPSIEYSGGDQAEHAKTKQERYVSFPRDSSGGLEIHIDTCVRLGINRARLAVKSKCYDEDGNESGDASFLLGKVDRLKLKSIVGLERSPEIVLFSLCGRSGEIRHGRLDDFQLESFDRHFVCLHELVRPTGMGSRAWHESQLAADPGDLLQLTAKILFDSEANLKTINLAFDFSQAGVVLQTLAAPQWVDWLADFFTVVEYPVEGYVPPAILTEMQFDVTHSSIELIPENHPARISLALGRAKVC